HGTRHYLTVQTGFRPDQMSQQQPGNQAGLPVLAGNRQVSPACAVLVVVYGLDELLLKWRQLDRLSYVGTFRHHTVRLNEADDFLGTAHCSVALVGIRSSSWAII